jgi:hypothetical protein
MSKEQENKEKEIKKRKRMNTSVMTQILPRGIPGS